MDAQLSVRVSLLESQLLMRERLVDVLERGGFQIVGQYADPNAFLVNVPSDRPTVALVDLSRGDGPALLAKARKQHPTLRMLVLANSGEPSSDVCYREGAAGWLDTREANGDSLVAAVSAVARGERLFPLDLVRPSDGQPQEAESPLLSGLSLRERQVLACVAAGADNLKIATLLAISERTVKAHMSKLYLKLGAENRTQLALLALQLGVRPAADV